MRSFDNVISLSVASFLSLVILSVVIYTSRLPSINHSSIIFSKVPILLDEASYPGTAVERMRNIQNNVIYYFRNVETFYYVSYICIGPTTYDCSIKY